MANKLLFLGDVYLKESCQINIKINEKYVFNLESPITHSHKGYPGKINLKMLEDHFINSFKQLPLAVCLSNNHIIDYGKDGFDDTIAFLRKHNISYFGAGYKKDNCNNPLIVDCYDKKVALLGYACPTTSAVFVQENIPGVMPIDIEQVSYDITLARKMGAMHVVVSLHWGEEEIYLPNLENIKNARKIIDAGADMIVGHHSHCIQPYEFHKNKYIFYGQGNCIMQNLKVPANYIEHGNYQSTYEKKQNKWNKESLMVSYDTIDGNIEISKLVFEKNTLTKRTTNVARYNINLNKIDNYKVKYKISYINSRLKNIILNYILHPKILRIKHIKIAISIIKNGLFQK